jgi:hypothetical protein
VVADVQSMMRTAGSAETDGEGDQSTLQVELEARKLACFRPHRQFIHTRAWRTNSPRAFTIMFGEKRAPRDDIDHDSTYCETKYAGLRQGGSENSADFAVADQRNAEPLIMPSR